MRTTFKTLLLALPLLAAGFSANASDSAAGRWRTIDDETGRVKSIVEITQAANGTLSGRVLQVLQSEQGPHPVCNKCEGANKGKPIEGMTILWNVRPDGTNKWANGTILDPAKGKTYSSKVALVDNGRKLDVSGCISFICRTQTWLRDQ
ncbi:DUF2147 domain-containing protein [Stenotrophomonas pigmentata]|uniref:DUF2147 domain-containing protein n=1 Tax=Stenotrophomonas pigmentata TaxID=3055080 RepID=UPI0026ED1259|nr:DUF2147 domain-containing protein [Stenotrophomonas sp. 610A2]